MTSWMCVCHQTVPHDCWLNRMRSADRCHSVIRSLARSVHFTQQVAVNTRGPNLTHANTQTHTRVQHTHLCSRTHQPGLLSESFVHRDWLSNPHTCANNFLSPGDKDERRRGSSRKNAVGGGGGQLLFIYMEHLSEGNSRRRKKVFFPSPFYCQDDRFIVSIKKRICNEDPRLIAVEKLETFWDGNLQRSSLSLLPACGCGRSSNSLWGFNPIKKTIIYVCSVPRESARPLFSVSQPNDTVINEEYNCLEIYWWTVGRRQKTLKRPNNYLIFQSSDVSQWRRCRQLNTSAGQSQTHTETDFRSGHEHAVKKLRSECGKSWMPQLTVTGKHRSIRCFSLSPGCCAVCVTPHTDNNLRWRAHMLHKAPHE